MNTSLLLQRIVPLLRTGAEGVTLVITDLLKATLETVEHLRDTAAHVFAS
ncbi:MAG: hypothetical protein JO138_27890 [Acidobacteriaceae bacterium]|nr:hypothetical protein [Acidobacteriaceae bacterium]